MRSLVIIEVEHGEDTDSLQNFIDKVMRQYGLPWGREPWIRTYNVRVDLPSCFALESTPVCECDIDILDPECVNPEHINPPKGF